MFRLMIFRLSESYFRHRWLYLIPLGVMLLCAAGFMFFTKPKYLAQGIMYVQQDTSLAKLTDLNASSFSVWTTPAQATSNEASSLIQTDAYIRAVIKETSLEPMMNQGPKEVADLIDQVRKAVTASAIGDNQVLFGSSYEDPTIAVQLVSGMIDSFLRWKTNAQQADKEVALNFFTSLIGTYRDNLEKARGAMRDYLVAHPDPVRGDRSSIDKLEIARLQSDIDLAQTRYENAIDKEENARLSLAQVESDTNQTYIVIDSPHVPYKNAISRRAQLVQVGIFLVVGLLLSLGAVGGAALFDRTFRVPFDAYHRLSLPVLAIIPDAAVKPAHRRGRRAKKPRSLPAEEPLALPLPQKSEGEVSSPVVMEQAPPAEEAAAPVDAPPQTGSASLVVPPADGQPDLNNGGNGNVAPPAHPRRRRRKL